MISWKKKISFFSTFYTLSFRIFTFFWLAFFIIFTSTLIFPYLLDNRLYVEVSQKEISLYHDEIINSIRSKQLIRIVRGINILPMDQFDRLRPILVDNQGIILGARDNETPIIQQFMYNSSDPTHPLQKDFFGTRVVGPFLVNLDSNSGSEKKEPYLIYFISKINAQLKFVSLVFDSPVLLFLFIMLVSSPVLWSLSYSIAKPLRNLQKAANMVAVGNFKIDKSLEKKGIIELRQVGQSFNNMTEALNNLISHQQVLLSSISHELKTPLTRLQLSLALLRRIHGDSTALQRIEKESNLMDKMINDLLLLSRQQLRSHLSRTTFSIEKLLNPIIDNTKFEATQNNLQLSITQSIEEPQSNMLNGNEELLLSAIENVIRNALKYTKSSLEIKIYIFQDDLYIVVDDNGAGVPKSEYENIFKPFYRIDETRTRETGGTGLGLAIVSNIIHEHHGIVWAEQSHLGGLRVSIKLPLSNF